MGGLIPSTEKKASFLDLFLSRFVANFNNWHLMLLQSTFFPAKLPMRKYLVEYRNNLVPSTFLALGSPESRKGL